MTPQYLGLILLKARYHDQWGEKVPGREYEVAAPGQGGPHPCPVPGLSLVLRYFSAFQRICADAHFGDLRSSQGPGCPWKATFADA